LSSNGSGLEETGVGFTGKRGCKEQALTFFNPLISTAVLGRHLLCWFFTFSARFSVGQQRKMHHRRWCILCCGPAEERAEGVKG